MDGRGCWCVRRWEPPHGRADGGGERTVEHDDVQSTDGCCKVQEPKWKDKTSAGT